MIFFGWGRKSKQWRMGEDKYLVATWSYFHIFWCPIAGTVEWHIIGDERSKDIMVSKAELKRLIPENTPDINIWQKYGLLFLIAVGVIYSLVV